MKRLLVYLGASGRSGTTLLSLLLNNNPEVQSVGELSTLTDFANTNDKTCTCGRPVMDCPFWLGVQAEAERVIGGGQQGPLLKSKPVTFTAEALGRFRDAVEKAILLIGSRFVYTTVAKLLTPAHYAAAHNSLFWHEMTRRASRCPVIVDSSKSSRRLKALYLLDRQPFRLIFMIRDGRGVAASSMRRYGWGMEMATRMWVRAVRSLVYTQRSIPASKILRVRYESLCLRPREVMQGIYDFLQIPCKEPSLDISKEKSHDIGGNPMRFRHQEKAIQLDTRWHDELTEENLVVFDRIAGKWNRRLGYLGEKWSEPRPGVTGKTRD